MRYIMESKNQKHEHILPLLRIPNRLQLLLCLVNVLGYLPVTRNSLYLWEMSVFLFQTVVVVCCVSFTSSQLEIKFFYCVIKYGMKLHESGRKKSLTVPSFSHALAFHILIFISSLPDIMYLLSNVHITEVMRCILFVW